MHTQTGSFLPFGYHPQKWKTYSKNRLYSSCYLCTDLSSHYWYNNYNTCSSFEATPPPLKLNVRSHDIVRILLVGDSVIPSRQPMRGPHRADVYNAPSLNLTARLKKPNIVLARASSLNLLQFYYSKIKVCSLNFYVFFTIPTRYNAEKYQKQYSLVYTYP